MNLGQGITILPILHGRHAFAAHVRECCLSERYDCIAIDLPEPFAPSLIETVDQLPHLGAALTQPPQQPLFFIPADPADAAIEGIRQARQEHRACEFVGSPWLCKPDPLPPMPDPLPMFGLR